MSGSLLASFNTTAEVRSQASVNVASMNPGSEQQASNFPPNCPQELGTVTRSTLGLSLIKPCQDEPILPKSF